MWNILEFTAWASEIEFRGDQKFKNRWTRQYSTMMTTCVLDTRPYYSNRLGLFVEESNRKKQFSYLFTLTENKEDN